MENNFANSAATSKKSSPGFTKNVLIGLLSLALIGFSIFYFVQKDKHGEVIQGHVQQLNQVSAEKTEIQKSFDEALVRLDSMAGLNQELNASIEDKNNEIAKAKAEIRSILNKRNNTTAELNRAKELISSLNTKISDLEQVIVQLTHENQTLVNEKNNLIQEKELMAAEIVTVKDVNTRLESKVEIASTLNASNIAITPLNIKKSEKEKVTTTARRVDKFLISFDINNRIADAGLTDIYVMVFDPEGNLFASENAGTIKTREDGEKAYTAKVPVEVEPAKRKYVEFSFAPETDFKQGNYKIQIYQNGYMIGEGTRELKKGGLFG